MHTSASFKFQILKETFRWTRNFNSRTRKRSSKGKGVMIQLKSDYDLIRMHKNPLNEAAVIEISANSLRFFVAVIYNKHSNTKPFIICGDFNINIFEQKHYVNDYINIIASNGFVFGINEPTRVTHSTSTCLDLSKCNWLWNRGPATSKLFRSLPDSTQLESSNKNKWKLVTF